MVNAQWGGHKFAISEGVGFSNLELDSSIGTKQKNATTTTVQQIWNEKKKKYKKKKVKYKLQYSVVNTRNPDGLTLTAHLFAVFGCDVKAEAMAWHAQGVEGKSDYLYVGETKMFNFELRLVHATVQNIVLSPGGKWISADVALQFERGSK